MQVDLFMADMFDTLQSGKLVALGLYTDRTMVLHIPPEAPTPSEENPVAVPVTLCFCIQGLDDTEHTFKLSFEGPDGSASPMRLGGNFKGRTGSSGNLVHRFEPFLLNQIGPHQAILDIDGTSHRFLINFRATPQAE